MKRLFLTLVVFSLIACGNEVKKNDSQIENQSEIKETLEPEKPKDNFVGSWKSTEVNDTLFITKEDETYVVEWSNNGRRPTKHFGTLKDSVIKFDDQYFPSIRYSKSEGKLYFGGTAYSRI